MIPDNKPKLHPTRDDVAKAFAQKKTVLSEPIYYWMDENGRIDGTCCEGTCDGGQYGNLDEFLADHPLHTLEIEE